MTPFGSVATITCAVLEKQRGVKNLNKNIYMNAFLQNDHHGFLDDVQVTLIDKTQASDPTKAQFSCK